MKSQLFKKSAILGLALGVFTGSGLVYAQVQTAETVDAAATAAEAEAPTKGLEFEKLRLNFGVLEQNGFADLEFPFVNNSDKTITINEIKTTCGCTAAALEKKVFAPGEGDVIKAKFSAGRRKGTQNKSIRVDTDETEGRASYDYTLSFTGEVITLVELDTRVVDFGTFDQGTEKSVELKLYSYKDEPVKIINAESTIDGVDVTWTEPVVSDKELPNRPEGKVYEVTVTATASPDVKTGNLTGGLKISTDDAASAQLDAVVRGRVQGDLTAVPDNLFFGVIPPSEMTKRTVSITTRLDEKFVLETVNVEVGTKPGGVEDSAVEITTKVLQEELKGRPNTQVHEVSFIAPEQQGRYTGEIVFTGKIGEKNHAMKVPFNAYVRPQLSGANSQSSTSSVPAKLTPEQRQAKIDQMSEKLKAAKSKDKENDVD